MAKIGVIGAGAWGITLAKLLDQNQQEVTIWCHDEKAKHDLDKKHSLFALFSSTKLPKKVKTSTDLAKIVTGSDILVLVVASHFYRKMIKALKPILKPEQVLISATKGLEEDSMKRMSEVAAEELGESILERFVVLSGPNLSKEIRRGHPAAAVAACKNMQQAEKVQEIFSGKRFRVYSHTDVRGVELGGTLKNIIAIASGIADGFRFGTNSKAALMVRGAVEMGRLAVALGAEPETLMGLAGMGDLIATCSSKLSRNHQVGEELAKGRSLVRILKGMSAVAEGVKTTKAVYKLAQQKGIELPITEQVYQVLYKEKSPKQAICDLMARDPKSEKA
ncbi:NAD(P)H-dependent glycerol-3-phosphate dehydrogenase [Candidatus Margulisiibacteriota bacterium]